MIMINNNLRIFMTVAEKGSFTRAADDMFISQPAVSRAIKALEDELNVKLFFRDKRNGLILTDVGRSILMQSRQMAEMENRIYQLAFRENNFLGGRVRVASLPILTSVILARVMPSFRNKYPFIEVEIVEGSSREIRKSVEEHGVDFGLAFSPFGELDHEVLMTDRMVSISRRPFENKTTMDLDGSPRYIMCRAGYETVMETLTFRKSRLGEKLIVQQAETVISLVREGNGIGIISELVLDSIPNGLYRNALKPPVETKVGLIALDMQDMAPAATALMSMIKEECNNYLGQKTGH